MKRFVPLLFLWPHALGAQNVPAADSAWKHGDTPTAQHLYSDILKSDSTDTIALHRMALMRAWNNQFTESLALFDKLLRLEPRNTSARIDRARVLAWRGDNGGAIAVLDSVLAAEPANLAAMYEQARFLTWANRFRAATAVYDSLLRVNPNADEAMQGRARVAAWSGNLIRAEDLWRKTLVKDPNNTATLVGLGQTLRWQGRDAASIEVLERALAITPTDRDARDQMKWARSAVAPRTTPGFVYETDSDGNRVRSARLSFAYRPHPRWELRTDGYLRNASVAAVPGSGARAQGGSVALWRQFEPGWSLLAGGGASTSNATAAHTLGLARVVVATPARGHWNANAAYAYTPVDGSLALIERQVVSREFTANANFSTPAFANVTMTASTGVFEGKVSHQTNRRNAGSAAITRQLARPLMLGIAARVFGFEKNLNDGYFDPDFYGIGEIVARVRPEKNRISLNADVAPGIQKIGKAGQLSGTLRASGRASYNLGIARTVEFFATFANSGLNQLAQRAGSGYQYHAFGFSGTWTF